MSVEARKHAERAERVKYVGSCGVTNKYKFATEAEALAGMNRLRDIRRVEINHAETRSQRRKLNTTSVWNRAYLCPWCDGWHLTSEKEPHV